MNQQHETLNKISVIEKVKYVGINDWNCPIFKSTTHKNYFGSTDILFPYGEIELIVLKKVKASDLVFFGSSFNCEPMGTACTVKIVK